MSQAFKIYKRLAQAFPHEFKLVYGTEVLQLGDDVISEIARRNGFTGLVRLIADIAIRVLLEYMSEMYRDMRYALRGMAKSPGFALVAILSMGIGMGLTTNLFSSRWQMIFRPLPAAANAERLVMPDKLVSYYYIEQYRDQKAVFTGVTAFQTGVPFNVTFQSDFKAKPQRIFGQLVSPDYFSVLGVEPQRGRMLSPDLEKPDDSPVVVISDRFWRNRLNSSPDAIGQTLHLNGQLATIVGITPRDFNGALSQDPSELFVPITVPATLAPELANDVVHQRDAREFLAIMCLAPGVNIESAEAALDSITRRLDEQDPVLAKRADKGRRFTLAQAGTGVPIPRNLRPVIIGFFAILMSLIMTLVCMNLANMLLARGANRRRELAIRLAIGASRFRLIRQMISEGVLLSWLGGIAGFALAYGFSVVRSHFAAPKAVPTEPEPTPDWHAAIFVFVLAIVCGIGFSLLPALRATKADVTPALKEGPVIQLLGFRRFGMRNLLMVMQVAGSLMLLLITGFLVVGFSKNSSVQTRFDPHTMFLLALDPVREGYSADKAKAFFQKLPERLLAAGSVNSVAMAAQPPFSLEDENDPIRLIAEDPQVEISAVEETVGAGYFSALNQPLLAGREFTELDQQIQADGSETLPAVVDESSAHGFFGNGNAIGKRFRDDKHSYEVVGVVRHLSAGMGTSLSIVYLPLTQRDFARPPVGGITVMVRSSAGSDALARIRREINSMDPNLSIFSTRTLSDYLAQSRTQTRLAVSRYGSIGVFGLFLAAIGLAGVTAYAVAQRRKEIGIRMALGARKAQVLWLVLREGAMLIAAGTVLGFLGAVAVSKMLSSLTSVVADAFKFGANDLRLIVGAPLLLAALALLACYVPARRSTRIDPLKALRQE